MKGFIRVPGQRLGPANFSFPRRLGAYNIPAMEMDIDSGNGGGPGRNLLGLYRAATALGAPLLRLLLALRARRGKEDPARMAERRGYPSRARPEGGLVWLHAASVGEAQSALILIDTLARKFPGTRLLVTTGTVTSAALMQKRLPEGAFHQFLPLDSPAWVGRFLDHWAPSCALWMESELWPNMLGEIRRRGIPAALVNARLSPRSARRWARAGGAAAEILSAFSVCLAQSEEDAVALRRLGARNVQVMENLKYAAAPLPCDAAALAQLRRAVGVAEREQGHRPQQGQEVALRPLWLYASTHAGEEALACRIHTALKAEIPDLLTIIVPRHPARGPEILEICRSFGLTARRRGAAADVRKGDDRAESGANEGTPVLPESGDDLYIADTLGELGLFYRLAPVACIGRSFSADGGGGHNPIEAARLGCAVLHGPWVQNLEKIYAEMETQGAAIRLADAEALRTTLRRLLMQGGDLGAVQEAARAFAERKAGAAEGVLTRLEPLMTRSEPPPFPRAEGCHAC